MAVSFLFCHRLSVIQVKSTLESLASFSDLLARYDHGASAGLSSYLLLYCYC